MRKVLVSLAGVAALVATPAMAETFSGPYVGVEVGLDNYEVNASDVFAPGDDYDGLSGNGIVGGIYAGYDIPLGTNLFAGIEAKASLSDAKMTYDDTIDTLRLKAKETFGASARLGVMVNDSTGIYGRAGWANTKFKVASNGVSDSDHDDALTLGAGLETRIGAATSVRIEYNRADYSDFVKNNQITAGVGFRF